ncbi:molybdopterin-dependent oxidoreductase [Chelativorans salis]|uniref:Molybdopterin-dependent oxidoreductase n=1 Tax=Chelativorans salis TaxID=2978478 RepID=A0ABT2LUW1_9HYPH|nr:molybdopterin-dependent oxidoreductase [Chelativorans sp. EGI FJ00035]MCT7378325.1 molybdopterin-dependent oxidoreductase [Chelativorans sp. EGI FJ00035]
MKQILTVVTVWLSLMGVQFFGVSVSAHALEQGTVLTITGQIAPQTEGTREARDVDFTIADLETLPQTEMRTYTDWTEGLQSFSGVLLKDLIDAIGASGKEIVATALNDYSATIPVSDAYELSVLLAIKHNGQYMRIRDKGPVWIIYPSTESSSTKVNPYNDRMIWQLYRLEFR